ncbi:MAG: helix-turn-helix transcriptional regulator [Rhodospirillaceae bacterium]|nr:helix-turn-helix transcriptional regulator [Rhodospirillaceae bacterium]
MASRKSKLKIEESSGNVFADIGLPHPEEELARAQLSLHIMHFIKSRRMTQKTAAKLMKVDQPKVSAIFNGHLEGFSSDRLLRMLTMLGQDVDITIRGSRRAGQRGRVFVRQAA